MVCLAKYVACKSEP
uniref:Uncharacterized protein n=1 Tax=Arundo donax TaxID=35708 RepID=A0A0A9ADG9_ARUDO